MSGIGALFGQRNKGFRKVELVILLKPTVIQGDAAWRPDLLDAQERLRDFDPRRDPLTR
jgi:MSHA biogenesis protein MshL